MMKFQTKNGIYSSRIFRRPSTVWHSQSGGDIPIADLQDNHLDNAINMLEDEALKELNYLETRFPDVHQFLNGMPLANATEILCPIYRDLVNDRNRRQGMPSTPAKKYTRESCNEMLSALVAKVMSKLPESLKKTVGSNKSEVKLTCKVEDQSLDEFFTFDDLATLARITEKLNEMGCYTVSDLGSSKAGLLRLVWLSGLDADDLMLVINHFIRTGHDLGIHILAAEVKELEQLDKAFLKVYPNTDQYDLNHLTNSLREMVDARFRDSKPLTAPDDRSVISVVLERKQALIKHWDSNVRQLNVDVKFRNPLLSAYLELPNTSVSKFINLPIGS